MNVRAITVGTPLQAPLRDGALRAAAALAKAAQQELAASGVEVQTTRLATPPLSSVMGQNASSADILPFAEQVDAAAGEAGFGYVSLGAIDTVRTEDRRWKTLLDAVPDVIQRTERIFCSASVAQRGAHGGRPGTPGGQINLAATRACGELVARVAHQSKDGFGNLRFAALANCPPHIPFFPAAYHDGGDQLTLGLALEAADLAVNAFSAATSLDTAREALVETLTAEVKRVQAAARRAAQAESATFTGVDLSLAPFPADDRSIANAFERLGLPAFGAPGTLFLASFLTECLQLVSERVSPGQERRFGFSGVMLPVLEDSTLAERAAQGTFGVDSLLLYSAVCGLGLDTVPLPGDTPAGELGAIILDMAALAVRLDKPLTARLFPVPGKRAGDDVSWEFAFFAPSRVLPVRGLSPSGVLAETARYNPAVPPKER